MYLDKYFLDSHNLPFNEVSEQTLYYVAQDIYEYKTAQLLKWFEALQVSFQYSKQIVANCYIRADNLYCRLNNDSIVVSRLISDAVPAFRKSLGESLLTTARNVQEYYQKLDKSKDALYAISIPFTEIYDYWIEYSKKIGPYGTSYDRVLLDEHITETMMPSLDSVSHCLSYFKQHVFVVSRCSAV